MKEVVIQGQTFLAAPSKSGRCRVGDLKCAIAHDLCNQRNGLFPCAKPAVIFIRPEQKLDYITERLKS